MRRTWLVSVILLIAILFGSDAVQSAPPFLTGTFQGRTLQVCILNTAGFDPTTFQLLGPGQIRETLSVGLSTFNPDGTFSVADGQSLTLGDTFAGGFANVSEFNCSGTYTVTDDSNGRRLVSTEESCDFQNLNGPLAGQPFRITGIKDTAILEADQRLIGIDATPHIETTTNLNTGALLSKRICMRQGSRLRLHP